MAVLTICSDFGGLSLFPLFAHLFAMKWWDWKQKGKIHIQKGKRPKKARKLMPTNRTEKCKSNGEVKTRKVNALGDC